MPFTGTCGSIQNKHWDQTLCWPYAKEIVAISHKDIPGSEISFSMDKSQNAQTIQAGRVS